MHPLSDRILEALTAVQDPDLHRNIVELGFVKDLLIQEGRVSLTLELTSPACPVKDDLKQQVSQIIAAFPGVTEVVVRLSARRHSGMQPLAKGLADVGAVIAVSSCKGGVGKSMTAVNLAFALSEQGASVGLFDADVYGPSLPTMVALPDTSLVFDGQWIKPLQYKGVKLMSFGYTQSEEDARTPALMRGPMVSQVINQLLTQTQWGALDYLILDMPPGTGDIHLTVSQMISITAAVIVTTPQQLSFVDVIKGIEWLTTMKVPPIAVVENMAYFDAEPGGTRHYPFGRGALSRLTREFGFQHAFSFPIDPVVSHTSDAGDPLVLAHPTSPVAQQVTALSAAVVREVSRLRYDAIPTPEVSLIPAVGVQVSQANQTVTIPCLTLRLACRCARCRDEWTDRVLVTKAQVPEDVVPEGMGPVGNYAVGINWSDGHSSIFPYDVLWSLAAQSQEVTHGGSFV